MGFSDEGDSIRRILAGETGLYSVFIQRYSPQVFALIVKMVSCPEDAEELTQDVFVKAFNKLDSFKGKSGFSTWLYRIAYNTAISALRKKRRVFPVMDERQWLNVPDEAVDAFLEGGVEDSRLDRLDWAVSQLTPEERVLVLLYYAEDRPVAEVAEVMGITRGNVKARLFRIRKKLYTLLKIQRDE